MANLRYLTVGESHGKALIGILEGIPSGLPLSVQDINTDLGRRQLVYGRGGRMKIESDRVEILSGQLCDLVGIDERVLPEILPTAAEIGTVTRWGAEGLGISERAKVFNGSMDSTAETFAAGVRDSGQFVIRLASAGGLHVIANPAVARRNLISYPYCGGPFWLSQAAKNTCATAVAWARDVLSATDAVADFSDWSKLASQSPPGANGVMFHPYLSGERCPYWDGDLRASFTGLSLHSKKSDLARAVYEGTAYALRDAARVLEAEGLRVINIKDINEAILFDVRNAYQNYNVAVNLSDKVRYTYMGVLKPNLGNANYCSAGQLLPLLNDPYYKTIGVGTKIFLGGGIGYVAWHGTQHSPTALRGDNECRGGARGRWL